MLTGKNLKTANVIIDSNLRVTDASSSFRNFFKEKKDWDNASTKITDLVKFDNLIRFKKLIQNIELEDELEKRFKGTIVTQKNNQQSVIISIAKVDKDKSNWSNQMIQLVCTEVENLTDTNEIKYIELEEQLDASIREISSNLLLLSQKNQLLETIVKQIYKILPLVNPSIKSVLRKIITNINSQKSFDENWDNLKFHYVNINPTFFQNIKKISNKITEKDLRHCTYIKMGLSVKETSQLLFLQPKSVEMARYRIKKKLNLTPEQSLSDFIRNL